jgi:hypothetical protein
MSWRPILRCLLHPKRTAEETALLQRHVAVISRERDELKETVAKMLQYAPPGHFYSPVPSPQDVEDQLARYRKQGLLGPLPAVQMEDETQLEFLNRLKPYYSQVPFQFGATEGLLYQYDNPHFIYSDAIILFCALNCYRPARMIEIGSGFSTCVTLDTNRLFLNSKTKVTSIEPHAKLLRDLTDRSHDQITIIESKLQDIDLEVFDQLGAGDILFIDSTHISKTGSDVNCAIFELLPRLRPGVIVHIHDIYLGYEYPDVWLREGRAWNESYLLRAFLEYNERFRILLFVSYMQNKYEDWFRQNMPDTLLGKGGSFWMEKL